MKKTILSVTALLIAAASLFSCGFNRNVPDPISVEKRPINENPEIVAGDYSSLEKFCTEFSKKTASIGESGENSLFSPISAYFAMAMMSEGASGVTLEEFNRVFGEINGEDVYELISHLSSLESTTLKIADSVWLDTAFTPKNEFINTLSHYYLAEAYNVNMETAEKQVNSWIEDKTNGMIKDMLSDDAFDADTVMALVNAIYMNATWRDEFNANLTRKREFTAADRKKTETDFMSNGAEDELIVESEDYIGVALPYSDGSLSFVAVMPKDESLSTDALMKKIAEDGGFAAVGNSGEFRYTSLFLPIFEVEYTSSLNEIFIAMGLGSAFGSFADFSGIADKIMIGNVLQNAHLRLDEKGTEAAAATVIEVKATGAILNPKEPLLLEFNRPFIYAVYDKDSGAVLFCGEYNEVR